MRLLLLLPLGCLLGSCASKSHIDPAAVIPNSANGPILHELKLETHPQHKKTGVYTLESGGQSLLARLWLFSHAQQTIDIQYYSVAKDVTGIVVTDCLIRAADRGVKVRLLIDDAASKMYNRAVRLLDSHENIEVRVYNAGLKLGSIGRRLPRLLRNGNRLLRRMHNKCVIIDNAVCISGGRNIADEYFDYDHRYNFRDRDVMLTGSVSGEAKQAFEAFWNHELTVPYIKLSPKLNKQRYKKPGRFNDIHDKACDTSKFSNRMRHLITEFPAKIAAAEQSGELAWAEQVSYVSDKPGKNEDRKNREGGASTDSLVNVLRNAKNKVDIQSPYFITLGPASDAVKELSKRGIKLRLLTNSLASIDNFEAYGGYLKSRKEILDLGIELHEFRPDAKVKHQLMVPEVQAKLNYKPVFGFHSKTLLVDSSTAIIGSYNLDPRSSVYNTECIVIIRSRAVVRNLSKYIEPEFQPENSWPVTKECKPDSKAPFFKRLKAFFWIFIPKRLL